MMQRIVYDYYGLYVVEQFQAGRYTGFRTQDAAYLFVPESVEDTSLWDEKLGWAQALRQRGDQSIAAFIPTLTNNYSIPLDGEHQRLFQLFSQEERKGEEEHSAVELATFHQASMKLFPPASSQMFAQRWSHWWEKRLEQLENWLESVKMKTNYSDMDRWFIKTFPYYLGLTENAIQWLKAIPVNEQMEEFGCINHFCFTPEAWVIIEQNTVPNKLPSDWLYDHPTRDVAEWIRYALEQDTPTHEIETFVQRYEQHNKITSFGWKLIVGRLLFPYYYVEQMEQTYLRENLGSMEQTLHLLEQSWKKEGERLERLALLKQIFPGTFHELPDWLLVDRNGFSVKY